MTTTTTTTTPASYATPADVLAVRKALTSKGADKLTTDDYLVMMGNVVAAQQEATRKADATIKQLVSQTVARYEGIGMIINGLFHLVGTDGTAPASNVKVSVADARKMFTHLKVDVAATYGMSESLMQVCIDAYRGDATTRFATWSDLRASDSPVTIAARDAAPSFYANDAKAAIRFALALDKGNVEPTTGHVLRKGNRAAGAEAEKVRVADLKVTRDEDAKRALADATAILRKRAGTLIGVGGLTVDMINALDKEALDRLALFISARREMLKATKPQHDAGKAAATTKAAAKPTKSTSKAGAK
jgi:hypothetical protein